MVALERYMWACKIHKVSWGPLGGACLGYSPKVKGRWLHVCLPSEKKEGQCLVNLFRFWSNYLKCLACCFDIFAR